MSAEVLAWPGATRHARWIAAALGAEPIGLGLSFILSPLGGSVAALPLFIAMLVGRAGDVCGTVKGHGPGDFGAAMGVAYDGVSYQRSVELLQHFGAAPSEALALEALSQVGAENWVLAQPRTPEGASEGRPHTFMWGFRRTTQP